MKKLLSFILAFALILSLSVSIFADEPTGTITITNATIGQKYNIYKIFDATISQDTEGNTDAVSYSIPLGSEIAKHMFGDEGTTDNTYFNYTPSTGAVTKKASAVDSELIAYLTQMVNALNIAPAKTEITANSATVRFENLPYGYYLVTSSLGATVTITSNTPNAEVIDKNQEPATDFSKKVLVDIENSTWGQANSASIGDGVNYAISFTATNYDGPNQIKYYQVHDTKGDGLWADFETLKVIVGGVELKKGYYLNHGTAEIDAGLEFMGDWGTDPQNANEADWYLVHLGIDEFRITIPWLENHTLEEIKDSNGNVVSHKLGFTGTVSKYSSPVTVEIQYSAAVEANAVVGGGSDGNLYNRASASWTCEHESGSSQVVEVVTSVYGIGVLKDDGATGENLAGAQFRLYRDEACTDAVYVIPTDIQGVYIVDSKGTYGERIHGLGKNPTRVAYQNYLQGYLGDDFANKQDNLVISQVNGKIVVLGLKAGDYYLKEIKAPNGYNSLSLPVKITAGEGTKAFNVFADVNGNVADIQTDDGIHYEHIFQLTSTIVHNSKGTELPSTGGEGTFWLITIGTLMAIGFAVFLITHKKMSVYTD